jgi:hypothetical protein
MYRKRSTLIAAIAALLCLASTVLVPAQDIGLTGQVLLGCDIDIRPKADRPVVPVTWEEIGTAKAPGFKFVVRVSGDNKVVALNHNADSDSKIVMRPNRENVISWVFDDGKKKIKLTIDNGTERYEKDFDTTQESDPLGALSPPKVVLVRTGNANPDLSRVRVIAENYGIRWSFVLQDYGL